MSADESRSGLTASMMTMSPSFVVVARSGWPFHCVDGCRPTLHDALRRDVFACVTSFVSLKMMSRWLIRQRLRDLWWWRALAQADWDDRRRSRVVILMSIMALTASSEKRSHRTLESVLVRNITYSRNRRSISLVHVCLSEDFAFLSMNYHKLP